MIMVMIDSQVTVVINLNRSVPFLVCDLIMVEPKQTWFTIIGYPSRYKLCELHIT
jgi:hypothetical protein